MDARGNRSTTAYDSAGRVAASINPLDTRWSTIYSSVNQIAGKETLTAEQGIASSFKVFIIRETDDFQPELLKLCRKILFFPLTLRMPKS